MYRYPNSVQSRGHLWATLLVIAGASIMVCGQPQAGTASPLGLNTHCWSYDPRSPCGPSHWHMLNGTGSESDSQVNNHCNQSLPLTAFGPSSPFNFVGFDVYSSIATDPLAQSSCAEANPLGPGETLWPLVSLLPERAKDAADISGNRQHNDGFDSGQNSGVRYSMGEEFSSFTARRTTLQDRKECQLFLHERVTLLNPIRPTSKAHQSNTVESRPTEAGKVLEVQYLELHSPSEHWRGGTPSEVELQIYLAPSRDPSSLDGPEDSEPVIENDIELASLGGRPHPSATTAARNSDAHRVDDVAAKTTAVISMLFELGAENIVLQQLLGDIRRSNTVSALDALLQDGLPTAMDCERWRLHSGDASQNNHSSNNTLSQETSSASTSGSGSGSNLEAPQLSSSDQLNGSATQHTLHPLASHCPQLLHELSEVRTRRTLSLVELLPVGSQHYYFKKGSLTRPPCRRDVNWFLLEAKSTASAAQIRHIRETVLGMAPITSQQEQQQTTSQVVEGNSRPPVEQPPLASASAPSFITRVPSCVLYYDGYIANSAREAVQQRDLWTALVADGVTAIGDSDFADDLSILGLLLGMLCILATSPYVLRMMYIQIRRLEREEDGDRRHTESGREPQGGSSVGMEGGSGMASGSATRN